MGDVLPAFVVKYVKRACGGGEKDDEMCRGFPGQNEPFALDMSRDTGASNAKGSSSQGFFCFCDLC
jgi:hypothetical protein